MTASLSASRFLWIVCAFIGCLSRPHSVHAQQQPAALFETSTPLDSRITETPASIIQRFVDAHMPRPTRHTLTATERSKVIDALNALPPLPRRVLKQRLRSISFLDGISGNGLTIIGGTPPSTVYDIVIRGGILQENISEFLTRKERNCYIASGSPLTLSIDGGSPDAILYVLLHESVHVIDGTTRPTLTAAPMISATASPTELTAGLWDDAHTISAAYRSPLLDDTCFRTGKPVSINTAESIYQALSRTPFVSLYSTSSWYDDVAELVTWYHLTQRLHQPYRIVLRNGEKTIYSLEPMNSMLVTKRFPDLAAIYD